MKKVEHQIIKKNSYVFMILVIALFSGALVFALFMEEILFKLYIFKFFVIFTFVYIITRKENNEMFQPEEYEEIVHITK